MPSSQVLKPGVEWEPPRTETRSSFSRPKLTAAVTSALDSQQTISAGRMSIIPFQTRRASS